MKNRAVKTFFERLLIVLVIGMQVINTVRLIGGLCKRFDTLITE